MVPHLLDLPDVPRSPQELQFLSLTHQHPGKPHDVPLQSWPETMLVVDCPEAQLPQVHTEVCHHLTGLQQGKQQTENHIMYTHANQYATFRKPATAEAEMWGAGLASDGVSGDFCSGTLGWAAADFCSKAIWASA